MNLRTVVILRTVPLVAAAILLGCGKPPPELTPPEPPVVTVAHPTKRSLAEFKEFTGRLVSIDSVEIRARVTGYLTKIYFEEGSLVKKGDPLFEIDPRPYEAILKRTEAEVANTQAKLTKANSDLERARRLSGGAAISREDVEKANADKLTAEASLASNQAAVNSAKLDLGFTKILAPVTGRIDRKFASEGNLVNPMETFLTRIVPFDPIYAFFDVDELTSLWYRERIFVSKTIADPREATKLKVWIGLKTEKEYPHAGEIDFISPVVTRETGTREVRGKFANADGYLNAGDSVRIRVEAGPNRDLVTVPETAVGSQQRQKFVYVINEKNEAVFRPVTLGGVRDGEQIVESGVTEADTIVVNGLLRVRPGVVVNPKSAEEKASPAAPAPKSKN